MDDPADESARFMRQLSRLRELEAERRRETDLTRVQELNRKIGKLQRDVMLGEDGDDDPPPAIGESPQSAGDGVVPLSATSSIQAGID